MTVSIDAEIPAFLSGAYYELMASGGTLAMSESLPANWEHVTAKHLPELVRACRAEIVNETGLLSGDYCFEPRAINELKGYQRAAEGLLAWAQLQLAVMS